MYKAKAGSKNICEEVLCAGFGGQGIMFMGKLLAQAGLLAGKNVTWMPSYGAEVRGGTAYSMAKVSDAQIANPVVTHPDVLIVMNEPSLIKYEDKLRAGGMLIMNRSLIKCHPKRKDVKVVSIPMTKMASDLGDTKCANMVAMGAYINYSRILCMKELLAALKESLHGKDELFLRNKTALEKGRKAS